MKFEKQKDGKQINLTDTSAQTLSIVSTDISTQTIPDEKLILKVENVSGKSVCREYFRSGQSSLRYEDILQNQEKLPENNHSGRKKEEQTVKAGSSERSKS